VTTAQPNRLGITDPGELAEVESRLSALAAVEILKGEIALPRSHGADRLTAIHGRLFGDLYDWAGQVRSIPLRKALHEGRAGSTVFTAPAQLRSDLSALFSEVRAADGFKGLGRLDFAERGADFLSRLNAAHPFEEGNGRTQRCYLQLMALDAGHELPMACITQERMVAASIRAAKGDTAALRDILDEQLDPTRLAALRGVYDWLESSGYESLNQTFLKSATPGERYSGVIVSMPANGGEHFVMHDGRSSIIVGNVADLGPGPHNSEDRVSFTAGRLDRQQADHDYNLAEQAAKSGHTAAAIETLRQARQVSGADPAGSKIAAGRLQEAQERDAIYRDRRRGIVRPVAAAIGR
jgi:cell filamentation protein